MWAVTVTTIASLLPHFPFFLIPSLSLMAIQCLLLLLVVTSVASESAELKKFLRTSISMNLASALPATMTAPRLANPVIGHGGRIYACSGKSLVVFESNGTLSWVITLNYECNVDIPPVIDERGKIYLIAEERVLKVTPSNIATSDSEVDNLFGLNSTVGGSGKIIGLAISIWYSSLFVTVKNRGLFAILLRGELLWSAGPVLYRFGYQQGCKKNLADCYFISAPLVDQCEGTLYISNTEGQIYSLYIRVPHFRWIQDFSSVDKLMTIVSGNNGLLYVIFPRRAIVMALEVSGGNVVWQNDVGPLSTELSLPIVDSNGWISIGSLDGFLYSFSPAGDVKKLLEPTASDSVIQVSPVLDCSGFALYISQTIVEGKLIQRINNYTYVSAMKRIDNLFSLLAPATGTVYWSGKYTGDLTSLVSKSDLHHFALDDRILLTFLSSARIGNTLPCYTTRNVHDPNYDEHFIFGPDCFTNDIYLTHFDDTGQKVSWTCSQAKLKPLDVDTGNEKAILVLLFFQLVILVLLAICVRFCYIFWRKTKLQDHGLIRFLEKRRSLRHKRKTLNRMITELEHKAADDSTTNEALQQLGEIVRAKEGVERKLSTCYSLGSDQIGSHQRSILPTYDGKGKSHSFHSSRKESVTIFNTYSDSSSSEECSDQSGSGSYCTDDDHGSEDTELTRKGKEVVVARSPELSSSSRMFMSPMYIEDRVDEGESEGVVGGMKRRMWLKRRTFSSTN